MQNSLGSKTPRTQLGHKLKIELLANNVKRFDGIKKQTMTPHFSRVTLLDPRFKKVAFGLESKTNGN